MSDFIDLLDAASSGSESADNLPAGQYCFVFNGPPIPQPRPNFWKGKVVNRNSAKLTDYKNKATLQLTAQQPPQIPAYPNQAVAVEVWFCMRPPDTEFVARDRSRGFRFITPGITTELRKGKPDLDNLLKFILDVMNGIACGDDKDIVSISAYKCYDNNAPFEGRTIVVVTEARNNNMKKKPDWSMLV